MSEAKFRNIAVHIEARIDEGTYPAGAKLPPHRDLAAEFNTTPVTISKAYKLLAEYKRVESFVGRGTFVVTPPALGQAIQAQDGGGFNFSILQPCMPLNFSYVRQAYRDAAESLDVSLLSYTENSGHDDHRLAGVQWLQQFGVTDANIGNTLLTSGAQHALSLVIAALSQPGDVIAVEALTYPGILAIGELSSRTVVAIDMDEHGLCPQHLKKTLKVHKPKLVITLPSHQNPTGITMTEERKAHIAKIMGLSSSYLVEDDIYAFLNPDITTSISTRIPEKGIYITSLSKAISPAMRCGYIKAPEHLIPILNAHIRANIWLASPLNFHAATQLIQSKVAHKLALVQKEEAQARQKIATEILGSRHHARSGFHIWLPLPPHWSSEGFTAEAKRHNITISSGLHFSTNEKENKHVRISLMAIGTRTQLKDGLKEIKALLDSKPLPNVEF
ncbi:PLP-dependent aminotransferase family protein [Enterovibrio nigricans]|uniref:DNA-binding transcriptional regulator, MocR family, contains an aminotransferase domain n=1 Tax=Enterovibrio nigricans DSM 22720 TaxID=1121868 RepID=A0A1T4W5B5_9GAMM|nr:PLP-dependent aminotransferase family protein [Enterovibrio nigricans]SKA72514.1 DNA-binding transcriptional regulator, MocR family, contains an aminotransferase domain [Enterovibrio nigricans DSM 22720]